MQMDVNETLHPFYTTKKIPHVTVTITKKTLRWQQYPGILVLRQFTQYAICRFSTQGISFQVSIAMICTEIT